MSIWEVQNTKDTHPVMSWITLSPSKNCSSLWQNGLSYVKQKAQIFSIRYIFSWGKKRTVNSQRRIYGHSLSVLHRNYVTMIGCHYKETEHSNGRKRQYQAIPTFCNAPTYEVQNVGRYTKVTPSTPNIPQCSDLSLQNSFVPNPEFTKLIQVKSQNNTKSLN